MVKSTATSTTSTLAAARDEAFYTGLEVLDLLEECDAATTWRDTIRHWHETASCGDELAIGTDDLSLLLLAIERLVDSRLRAARTQRAPVQIEMLESLIRPGSEPSGTATALRFLLVVRRLALLAHPEKGPGIIRAAETCDPAEAMRLWHESQGSVARITHRGPRRTPGRTRRFFCKVPEETRCVSSASLCARGVTRHPTRRRRPGPRDRPLPSR